MTGIVSISIMDITQIKYRRKRGIMVMGKLFENSSGSYSLAFFCIRINGIIDFSNFENNPLELKGTFIHEYCHFLQDVSTTYGYTNFIRYIQEFLFKIGKVKDSRDREVMEGNKDYYSLLKGDTHIKDLMFNINDIYIEKDEELFPNMEYVMVRYNGNKEFQFGSCCISESMAYLVEKRLYNIEEREKDFPYSVCEEICKYEYAEFAKDDLWIIALCELALLEVESGKFFIKALRLMKEKEFIPTKVEDIEQFINHYFAIGFRGNRSILQSLLYEMYPECSVDFSRIRKWILERFERAVSFREKSKCFISLALSNEDIRIRYGNWNWLMEKMGCPTIIDSNGNRIQGAYLDGEEVELGYMLAPMAINEFFDHKRNYIPQSCPLDIICSAANDPSYSEKCKTEPKENINDGKLCPVSGFWRLYQL